MKISVIARTLNEERNIERFCSGYQWADEILVADGGSQDNTISLASNFPNVQIRKFSQTIEMENGIVRNPHGEHLNFLIDWAKDGGADFIIHDDVDCFPNYLVKDYGRQWLESMGFAGYYFIYLTRIYLYKNQGHFPRMAQPIKSGKWEQGLWAWDAHTPLHFKEDIPASEHQQLAWTPPKNEIWKIEPPACLIHCPWQEDLMIDRKLNLYRKSGEIPQMLHPLEIGIDLEPLPEWAREEEK